MIGNRGTYFHLVRNLALLELCLFVRVYSNRII